MALTLGDEAMNARHRTAIMKTPMSSASRGFVLATALLLVACGKDSPTAPKKRVDDGTRVLSLARDTATLLLDEAVDLVVTVRNNAGDIVTDAPIVWTSSSEAIAAVSGQGHVSASGVGEAIITAAVGTSNVTARMRVVPQFTQIATGGSHACGITGVGRLYCWGSDLVGELGAGTASPDCPSIGGKCSSYPLAVSLSQRVASVAVGDWHTCALTETGKAYCWGADYYGQLGDGQSYFSTSAPSPVAGGLPFASLAMGRMHTCGITAAGDAYCWGSDYWGQLGSGTVPLDRCTFFFNNEACSRVPLKVVGGQHFTSIVGSDRASCGLAVGGATFCWGLEVGGADGTLCQGGERTDCTRTPINAANGFVFSAIGIGDVHKCGKSASGVLSCWGADYFGIIGNGTKGVYYSTPVTAAGGASWSSFVSGFSHLCALTATGEARCWGQSLSGEVGDGTDAAERLVPSAVAGNHRFTSLSSTGQSSFTCGLLQSSRAVCWGHGTFGELGNGAMSSSSTPVPVKLIR
jgi:alpha-tubulin suppressor-like RCC1 family protein